MSRAYRVNLAIFNVHLSFRKVNEKDQRNWPTRADPLSEPQRLQQSVRACVSEEEDLLGD